MRAVHRFPAAVLPLCALPAALIVLAASPLSAAFAPLSRPSVGAVGAWVTTSSTPRLSQAKTLRFVASCAPWRGVRPAPATGCGAAPTIVVDPGRRFQRIAGFGGAFNERGWAALGTLTPEARASVLRALFATDSGAGYALVRTPIGASDYALGPYALDEMPGDRTLSHFSIARDRQYLLPYLHAALHIAPDLTIWASPWSAPGWMKSNGSLTDGGRLLARYEPVYAQYLADFARAYAGQGVRIAAISVQNEPTSATPYPSMQMSAAQMGRFVGIYLGPLFTRLHLRTAIRINEEPSRARWPYTLAVLAAPGARAYVAGSNLHGYHGMPDDLAALHRAAPALDIWQTEDTHLDRPHYEYIDAPRWAAQIARDLQNWVSGWDFWNLVTDQTGRSSWGWTQDAVVIVDTIDHQVRYTPKYEALAHFSRFIRPGAYRIGVSGVPGGLAATAARNPDGSIALVVANPTGRRVPYAIESRSRRAETTLPPYSIATYTWR